MSITLNVAAATTIVLSKVKNITNGKVFQFLGSSFAMATRLTTTLNVGKTGTAKARGVIALPYTPVGNTTGVIKYGYVDITYTVPVDMPITEANKLPFLGSSLGNHLVLSEMVNTRSQITE